MFEMTNYYNISLFIKIVTTIQRSGLQLSVTQNFEHKTLFNLRVYIVLIPLNRYLISVNSQQFYLCVRCMFLFPAETEYVTFQDYYTQGLKPQLTSDLGDTIVRENSWEICCLKTLI